MMVKKSANLSQKNMSQKCNVTQVLQQINRRLPILSCFFLSLLFPWNKHTTDRVVSAEKLAFNGSVHSKPIHVPQDTYGHLNCILKCLSNAQWRGRRGGGGAWAGYNWQSHNLISIVLTEFYSFKMDFEAFAPLPMRTAL